MKQILWLMIFILIHQTADAKTITLKFDDLPELISSQNGYVLAEGSYVEGAASQKSHLKRSFLPEVTVDAGFEHFKTGDLDFKTQPVLEAQTKVNLLRGGQDYLQDKIIHQKFSSAENSFKKVYFKNLLSARVLYADVLFYQEQLVFVKQALASHQNNLHLVQKQIDAGIATETDRLEFMIELNELKQNQISFTEDYENSLMALKNILGLDSDTSLSLQALNFSHIDKKVFDQENSFASHPDVAKIKSSQNIAELQKIQLENWWLPHLDVYALYGLYSLRERESLSVGDRDDYVVGVNLSLNLFDGLKSITESKELKAKSFGLQNAQEQKVKDLNVELARLKRQLTAQKKIIGLLHQNINQKQRYVHLSSDEYTRGVKTATQLFVASQQLFKDKQKLSKTRRDLVRTLSALFVLMGY